MSELAGGSMPDAVTQLFELFDVYRQHFPEETFDHYYPWGEVMLKDFEELDKSLADPEKVFAVIADMKEIDSAFALESEDMDRLKMFWSRFFDREHTRLKDEFAGTWRHLLPIYEAFHKRLAQKGWCTEGQSFRLVADRVKSGTLSPDQLGKHIVFAGLYALSKSEEELISHLLDHGKASVYWDADLHYTEDTHQEAGLFLRKSDLYRRFSSTWTEPWLSGKSKSIEVIGVPMEVGQAKVAGSIVHALSKEPGHQPERTAVILPDEHLLFPVLYALPESVQKINVTMGYPLHQTPIYYLFESLIQLQRNIRPAKDPGRTTYYFKDVQALLDHPYIRLMDPKGIRDYSRSLISDKAIRIRQADLHAQPIEFFQLLFKPVNDSGSLFSWCKEVLAQLLTAMGKGDFEGNRLESEFISRFYSQLNRLESIYTSVAAASGLETWWGLFRQIIHATKIPFSGEPLEGLQVMGFLESRVLDFDDIVLLSVNEDILPAAGQHPTFIPYGIRKAFGLPTHEDQHAVTAYHFYRLLQRARRIWLLHNTESQSLTSGEPSRFIFQLEEELAKKYPDKISWNRKVIATAVNDAKSAPVIIEKTPDVLQRMARWLVNPADPDSCEARLSATAFNNYIACPLRFYFNNVAGVSEPEEKEEALESRVLGNVLHMTMELLYKDVQVINKKDLKGFESRVAECLDLAIEEKFMHVSDLEGKNVLLRDVLLELALKIIRIDCAESPVKLHSLER
ncbi:MAG: PD-(D/E)XK nuclease family protein, partial [Bacteroidota bacterium]